MKVVLMRKLADCIDGVDISGRQTGEVIDVPAHDARLLVAEEWAIPDRRHSHGPPPEPERRGAGSEHGRSSGGNWKRAS
jgi:hypothetical protein